MVLAKFRQRYPQGSLVSELVDIDRGTYIVKVSVRVENIILATGLAGANQVETAEDTARERAIAALDLDSHQTGDQDNSAVANSDVAIPRDRANEKASVVRLKTAIDNYPNGNNDASAAKVNPLEPKPTPSNNISDVDSPPVATEPTTPPITESPSDDVTQSKQEPVENTDNLFAGTFEAEDSLIEENNLLPTPVNSDSNTTAEEISNFDFNEVKQKTDLEIRRLGWTKDVGREFLKSRYGKRSRLHLTNEQLLEFLHYLETQPSPS